MRNHHRRLSFLTKSQPPEAEPSALENYRAAHPQVRELQDGALAEFRTRLAEFQSGLSPLLHQFIGKAEAARQIGIVLLEFTDTLPGKKLTRDFYEQTRHWFVDAQGQPLALDLLEWFMAVARRHPAPIDNMAAALKHVQPLLLAGGEPEFQLTSEAPLKQRIPPKDDMAVLTDWFDELDIEERWRLLQQNPNYFPGGQVRPDLRDRLAEEWRPKIMVIEDIRRTLGI